MRFRTLYSPTAAPFFDEQQSESAVFGKPLSHIGARVMCVMRERAPVVVVCFLK